MNKTRIICSLSIVISSQLFSANPNLEKDDAEISRVVQNYKSRQDDWRNRDIAFVSPTGIRHFDETQKEYLVLIDAIAKRDADIATFTETNRSLALLQRMSEQNKAQQLVEQEEALQAMKSELEQTKQQQQLTSQELAQFHEVKKRIIAQLALFETLHTNNRESLMIETIKSELNALSHKESP